MEFNKIYVVVGDSPSTIPTALIQKIQNLVKDHEMVIFVDDEKDLEKLEKSAELIFIQGTLQPEIPDVKEFMFELVDRAHNEFIRSQMLLNDCNPFFSKSKQNFVPKNQRANMNYRSFDKNRLLKRRIMRK